MMRMILRENDVTALPRPVFACGAKNRCPPIKLILGVRKLLTLPETMSVRVLREIDVLALWAWFCGHAQRTRGMRGTWEAVERHS